MYHISKDKRAMQSAELIYKGLVQCLAHKAFDAITVTDIQKSSGVARTTFYRCFDDLSDVLYWRCDLCFQQALHVASPTGTPSEQVLIQGYFSYWATHSDILELLINIDRQDIIYTCHMNNAEILAQSYGALPALDEVSSRYFMAIRTGVTIGILKAWLDGGRKESAEELVQIVKNQFKLFI